MAAATLTSILQDILKYRSEDVSKFVKALENLTQYLKQPSCIKEFNEKDDKTQVVLVKLSVQSYCHALRSAKLARGVDKVMRCLPKYYRTCFIFEMKTVLHHLLMSSSLADLKTLSALLDQNISVDLISQDHFPCFSRLLQSVMENRIDVHKMRHDEDEEFKRCYAKICIQVLQMFPQDVRSVLNIFPEHRTCSAISGDVQAWRRIITALLNSLVQSSSQDIAILAGTALAMTFSYASSHAMTQTVCLSVLSMLSKGQTCMEFSGLKFEVEENVSAISDDASVPIAAMVKGILVSCDKELLSRGHNPLLLQVFQYILQLCQGPSKNHYQAFSLLALWHQKLEYIGLSYASSLDFITLPASPKEVITQELLLQNTATPEEHLSSDNSLDSFKHFSSFMCKCCHFLTSTFTCIWPNWESAVEGVSELVVEIFGRVLRLWDQAVTKGISDYVDLSKELLSRILNLSWHSKARYRSLCVLLKYVDCIQVVQANRDLRADLMRCMRFNQLAAVACDVYKACIQQIIDKHEQSEALQIWRDLWMPTLLSGLTAIDSLQSLKTRTYWLPPTLKLIVGSSDVLLNTVEGHLSSSDGLTRQQWFFAWISVSALAREILHTYKCPLASDFIKESLLCAEDSIRTEALKLLCTSVKRAEPMCDVEANLLQEFIPANMKTDSTAFRQNMTSALKKMFVRIRDSCLSAVRSGRTEETFLAQSLQFIDWLQQLLMCNLIPGGCYQRRQTSLDLLVALLDTFIYQPDSTAKKGKAQETSDILLLYAHKQDLWHFFSDQHFMTLIYCLEDGVHEIQTQCYNLLVKYFKWPKVSCDMHSQSNQDYSSVAGTSVCCLSPAQSSLITTDKTCAELFHRAFCLISSPRAYENHSGVVMMSLVMNSYIMRYGWTSSSSCEPTETPLKVRNSEGLAVGSNVCHNVVTDTPLALLDLLIGRMKLSLDAVLKDLGASFHTNCLHGLTQTTTQCLLDITEGMRKDLISVEEEIWRQRLQDIVLLNQKIIHFVLELLAGGRSFENCPSFAEMGVALNNLISTDQEDDTLSLSPEFQLILSWCWLNIKESCSCLGEVTSLIVVCERLCPFLTPVLSEIGEIFVKVLTTCRHRGAIEGSRHGLYHFCSSLMSSSCIELNEIPCTILQQVLGSLSQNSLLSSVTRRSAGLPIIIQTVLQAAHKNGNKTLLTSTVEQLFDVASQQLPMDHNQLQDLSQSHALNILKTIFCNASLAPQMMPLLSKMTILVVEGFDSPSWAIRNAATQLISTLVTRIFGQKNSEEASSSLSLEDFSFQYPQLVEFVCEKMKKCITSKTKVRPSLYVVLTLLSELEISPSYQHSSRHRDFLRESVLTFIASPVFSLRKLSARAYVALSPLDMADATLNHILQKIGCRDQKLNELHGWLLSAAYLISLEIISQNMYKAVLMFVVENKWLLFKFPSCLLPVSTLMQVIKIALFKAEPDILLLERLWEVVKACILSISTSEALFQIDREQSLRLCVQILIQIESVCNAIPATTVRCHLSQFLHDNLYSSYDHLREAITDCLQSDTNDIISDPSIQRTFLAAMATEKHMTRLLQSADHLIKLALRGDLHLQPSDFHSFDLSAKKKQWEKVHNFETVSFLMETIFIGCSSNSQNENRFMALKEWCNRLLIYTRPSQNEDLRIYAARALAIAGGNILKFCSTNKTVPNVGKLLSSVIKASMQLLEDTEVEVRQQVSSFISKTQGLVSLTSSWCYPALSSLICEEFYWSAEIVTTLFEILHTPGQLTTAITCALSTRDQVLFEPEPASAMSETFITQMWAYNTLQCILAAHPDFGNHQSCSQQLKVIVMCACEELSTNFAVIKNNLSEFPVFNISSDKEVLSCLLGLVFLSCLPLSSADNTEIEKAYLITLQKLVQSLLQISSLHPFLRGIHLKNSQQTDACRLVPIHLPLFG